VLVDQRCPWRGVADAGHQLLRGHPGIRAVGVAAWWRRSWGPESSGAPVAFVAAVHARTTGRRPAERRTTPGPWRRSW
jgi:hypothetical protein